MSRKGCVVLALTLALAGCAPTQKKPIKDPEKDPQNQYEKAVISFRYNLEDEALKYLNLALSLDPVHAPSLLLLGNIEFKKDKYDEAAAAFQRYLEIRPSDPEAHVSLGLTYENLGRD